VGVLPRPRRLDGDATAAIEAQIERFAPGFRDTILARHTMSPADFQAYNPNDVNGAIGGGAVTLGQLVARPRLLPNPYVTPIDGVYLCSSATAPGAGTHGMCGYHAAGAALRSVFGRRRPA
jgi:phytoene dehydrogenase-like protein